MLQSFFIALKHVLIKTCVKIRCVILQERKEQQIEDSRVNNNIIERLNDQLQKVVLKKNLLLLEQQQVLQTLCELQLS
ncbi:unnamed protein product [Paramecium octaurelia]|uniref:Uncharacterized protein n=1 Tax=Paramecium octaurelia TaxID=43137 RepID=A0A8S1YJM2_PAROT|nr:unnamed protein product [Paramecium octaurelia]CAD8215018.1 unnamed protein product [Paramecium octaurelia]